MAIRLESLITAFDADNGKSPDIIWNLFAKYLSAISEKQATGLTSVLLKSSKIAKSSILAQILKSARTHPALVRAASSSFRSIEGVEPSEPRLLNYAIETLLVSAEPTRITPGDFTGLFKTLTLSEFEKFLAPALVRALRRSASRSIHNLAGILECCRVDMSSCYQELMSALIDSLKTSDLVESASGAIGSIFRNCVSVEARLDIVKRISENFPRFGQQSVDVAVSSILTAICKQGCPDKAESVCGALIQSPLVAGLSKQLKSLASHETKKLIAQALSSVAAFVVEFTDSPDSPALSSALAILREDLCGYLIDKKSIESVKESSIVGIERVCSADRRRRVGVITFAVISLDAFLPMLTLLVQGRLTARISCLASWCVLFHLLPSSAAPADKRLTPILSQVVSSDVTFSPRMDGEETSQGRTYLRTITELSLKVDVFPHFAAAEMETITLGSMSERMSNRFCANILRIIAFTSFTSLDLAKLVKSRDIANRLVLALYEMVVLDKALVPGHLARVALSKVASVVNHMDPEWTSLLVVLAHHPYFASRCISTDHIWTHSVGKFIDVVVLRQTLDSLTGLAFQGGELAYTDFTGFRLACEKTISRIASCGLSDESILHLAKSALRKVDAGAVAKAQEYLGVYFCPESVAFNKDTEYWIPTESNTVAAPAPVVKGAKPTASSGVTREDMLRQTIKEQSSIRSRISKLASSNQFAIEAVSVVIEKSSSPDVSSAVAALISSRMTDILALLESPLTSASTKVLVDSVVRAAFAESIAEKALVSPLLCAVAMNNMRLGETEEWVALFNSVSDSTAFSRTEFELFNPLITVALDPFTIDQFTPEIAEAALGACERQLAIPSSFMPISAVLEPIAAAAKISPGPLASAIGKVLKLTARKLSSESEIRAFTAVGITDDCKLFHELAGALILAPSALVSTVPVAQAFSLMATYEESSAALGTANLVTSSIVSESVVAELVTLLSSEKPLIQRLASESLAFICSQPSATESTLSHLMDLICGGYSAASATDKARLGFAQALGAVGKVPLGNKAEFLSKLVQFVVKTAMEMPEISPILRDQLLSAVQDSLTANAETHAITLISLTETFIGTTKTEAAGLSVPVILGLVCKFLPATDGKVGSVRTKLIAQLLTAESPVQTKISSVLPPLLKMSDDVPKYLDTFLNTALSTSDARARYGAALGVGAATKAQGVAILRQMEVLKRLQEAAEDKTSTDKRQGAIAVYGGLSLALGRLFEPYVAQVLPVLLVAFGDNQAAVRDASNLAAGQIMANLSTHGIKLVLPSLLAGIEDLQWRTKLGSIKLLSAMLSCAPKQLATCLPNVVPALSDSATDTHSKVREAACAALSDVGAVVGNPEIRACSGKLIAALVDPANDLLRQEALDVVLSTSFVHSLDAASLALVIPVMLRATRERRSEIKRKGAQILGSIAVLSADPTEGLGPYMPRIVPALQDVLIDPIPDVRATAAKALGTMARSLPGVIVAEVLPWLFKTLKQAESQVERSGAAHGLSEVLVELGPEHFVRILPEVVSNAVNPSTNPEAREGYMGLFVFLPGVMRNAFVPYIETVFPVLIQGLSDPLQPVREVAQRAAAALCVQFGASNATLLMPSLERGLFAKDWRARQASVQLTGHTLENLMKNSRGNKDNLLECQVPLTQAKRSYMLAMLYIVRSDPNQGVNQNAQMVWKTVVSNTPRTLRLILPILVRLLINNLSSSEEETRQLLAGRCLGDLVGKLGERVLPDLMPILIENIESPDPMVRAGVCVGLADIVNAAHRQLLQEYFSIMFPAVRQALCDNSSVVRVKAGTVVGILYGALGNTTINSTLPAILEMVDSDSTNQAAIHGLEQLVSALPKELLPLVIDSLAVEPPSSLKIRALETVSFAPQLEVAKFVTRLVPYLMISYGSCPDASVHAANTMFSQFNRHSCHLATIELIRGLGDASNGVLREACASLLASCIKCAPLEVISEYTDTLVPVLVRGMLADAYQPAMEAQLLSFGELVTKLTKESMIKYMESIKSSVDDVVSKSDQPAGLGLPRTFETLWPVYQQALMFGGQDSREAAAKGLVVLVEKTPSDRLKPNAIKVTGPLIRVLGDRYPAKVRVALLKTLQVLLTRLEAAVKPFLPQLQTTYQKCAQDPDSAVKQLAEESQALLAKLALAPR